MNSDNLVFQQDGSLLPPGLLGNVLHLGHRGPHIRNLSPVRNIGGYILAFIWVPETAPNTMVGHEERFLESPAVCGRLSTGHAGILDHSAHAVPQDDPPVFAGVI